MLMMITSSVPKKYKCKKCSLEESDTYSFCASSLKALARHVLSVAAEITLNLAVSLEVSET